MADAVRLSAEDSQRIYERSFKTWVALYHSAIDRPRLPQAYLDVQRAFRGHPSFPHDPRIEHVKYPKHSFVYATGTAVWGSTHPDCEHGLPSFHEKVQLKAGSRTPIPLSVAAGSEHGISWASWFARGDQNYLPVLILAWGYILSARGAETMPGSVSFVYTTSKAEVCRLNPPTPPQPDKPGLELDISDVGPDEARWWAAVLAPGQGWQATMLLDEDTTFVAPWSVQLHSDNRFLLSSKDSLSLGEEVTCLSFSEALRFLETFCVRRNIVDQSQAALAAVLLFPSMGTSRKLQLPAFTTNRLDGPTRPDPPIPQHQGPDLNFGSRDSRVYRGDVLDRLITVSCHIKGIEPMLLSGFFDPSFECNAASPWLQGARAAIDAVAQDNPLVVGRMLMDRQPTVAPLWIGATILGLQKGLLRPALYGMALIDLPSAVWSGTIQSFIQQPVSDPLVRDGRVTRADQCRLLFLSRSRLHSRVPICQWRPFGGTPLEHTDIEVRAHANCKGHGLRYDGFIWDRVDGKTTYQSADGGNTHACLNPPPIKNTTGPYRVSIECGKFDIEKEFASESATRSIFGWLRFDGYAPDEKKIWTHEWFEPYECDEEDEEKCEESPKNTHRSSSHVETWISGLEYQESLTSAGPEILLVGNAFKPGREAAPVVTADDSETN
ncbi:hypothetical protein B0J18DRAFT_481102 [Chaetomium sp. MPI-SDFR-AT-0129]|nr:hypothetical protein B0J18DRAFT_481102 [Chaetomium sp. MPI-SDFR-AT-0129]